MPYAQQHTANPHTADLTDSYHLVLDTSMVFADVPGRPDIVGIHVQRDRTAGTYRLDYTYEALVPLAQRWLINRGADPAAVALPATDDLVAPADEQTLAIEEQLRHSGERYRVHDSYTFEGWPDMPARNSLPETVGAPSCTWVIAKDNRPSNAEQPVSVLWHEIDANAGTYTLREGRFPSLEAAYAWTRDTDVPLPSPAPPPNARAVAALERGTTVAQSAALAADQATAPAAAPNATRPATRGPVR